MRKKIPVLAVLTLALLLRVGYQLESSGRNPTFSVPIIDAYTYDNLAAAQVFGEGMGPESVWQPLFYPYFLASVYRIFGRNYAAVRAAQIGLGLLTCLLVYRLGGRLFSRSTGLVASLFCALSGTLIFYEGELLATTWAVFWFLLLLAVVVKLSGNGGWNPPRLLPSLLFGFAAGVTLMIRPPIAIFCLAAFVWILLRCLIAGKRRNTLLFAVGTIFGLALVLIPVLKRNHDLTGHRILLPTSGGLNLYIGNHPEIDDTLLARPGEGWRQLTALPRRYGIHSAAEGTGFFYRQAFRQIRNHPRRFLSGLARKTVLYLNAREIPRNIDIYIFREYSRVLSLLVWTTGILSFPMGLVIPLAILGGLLNIGRWKRLFPLYLFLFSYSLAIILVFVTSRYRMPAWPAFSLFAASALSELAGMARRRRYLPLILSLGALAVFFALANADITIAEDRVDFRSEMQMVIGSIHLERGEMEAAEKHLEEAARLQPDNAEAYYLLGRYHHRKGDIEEALGHYLLAIEVDPDHGSAHAGTASILKEKGDPEGALEYYSRAIEIGPLDHEVFQFLAEIHENAGRDARAAEAYWRALEMRPDSVPVRRGLARTMGRLDRWEVSKELIAEAIRHHPDDPVLRADLGVIYGNTGELEKAAAEFRESLRLHPDSPEAVFNLGMILVRMEKIKEAREYYVRLRELNPEMAGRLLPFLD